MNQLPLNQPDTAPEPSHTGHHEHHLGCLGVQGLRHERHWAAWWGGCGWRAVSGAAARVSPNEHDAHDAAHEPAHQQQPTLPRPMMLIMQPLNQLQLPRTQLEPDSGWWGAA